MPRPRVPLGTSDFLQLREDGLLYVDKSLFVAELLEDPGRVLLLPRPRRFGKTLNMSTARYFFERPPRAPAQAPAKASDVRGAFAGLAIEKSGERVWSHFQRHPVIFLSIKDQKGPNWSVGGSLAGLIVDEALRLAPAFEASLTADDRKTFEAIARGSRPLDLLERSLFLLTRWLHQATGEKAFVLIDEYDTPIHDVYGDEKRYEEVVGFFRNFFSAGLKDNPHLEKGVLTGILRVAKESMFSGLNNLKVHSILRKPFATNFGFSEGEVEQLCADFDLSTAERAELRSWYNGYRFGGHVVYNPWSVLSYLDDAERQPGPYWVNTGGDALIRNLLVEAGLGIESDIEALIAGHAIVKPIDEHVVLRDIDKKSDSVFSFLLMSGYLRADERLAQEASGKWRWRLTIPNKEIATVYQDVFIDWLKTGLGGSAHLQSFCRALLAGDAASVEEHLGTLLERTLSFHDTGGRAREVVYQAFVAGLLVALEGTHQVRSNRESGLGRCDVLIAPRKPGQPGVALELKVLRASETMEEALSAALEQVRSKKYAAELRGAGADPVVELAAVFDVKRVRVARG
ncbi:MAG: AAA family ATPase [Planctomycetes bacterium]|nr:AAA family ATPase [Planctomycetota bacterium]